SLPLSGDVDGDGRDDVIQYRADATKLPVCHALGTGWGCRDLDAIYTGGDGGAGNGGTGLYAGGTALIGDFNGDGRADVLQYNSDWETVPVCLSLVASWSCQHLAAAYVGG